MILNEARARKILDSRCEATIEVSAVSGKYRARASAPSGKSRGKNEAEPFSQKGIDFSISFLNMLGQKLVSEKISFSKFGDLEKIENIARQFDKTKNWNIIGGNAIYAIEAAILKLMAACSKQELWKFLNPNTRALPMPVGNCIGGGMHVKQETLKNQKVFGAPKTREFSSEKADIQEFLFIPQASSFMNAYSANLHAYKEAKKLLLERKGWKGKLTDENALASTLETEQILEILNKVARIVEEKMKIKMRIGIDMAASTLWDGKTYSYKNPKKKLSETEQEAHVFRLIEKYNLFYVEDPAKENFSEFSELMRKKRKDVMIVSDDLTATHLELAQKAVKEQSMSAVIIKPNQCGSLIEAKKVSDFAKKHNILTIMSHRSGETSDDLIADLAVAWQADFIKTGILGKERFAKLHRLLKIERQMGRR